MEVNDMKIYLVKSGIEYRNGDYADWIERAFSTKERAEECLKDYVTRLNRGENPLDGNDFGVQYESEKYRWDPECNGFSMDADTKRYDFGEFFIFIEELEVED